MTLVATAAVINLRHVMYSAALSPRFNDQPKWFRWVGPFFLIDQLFALSSVRVELSSRDWRHFYLTAGIFYFVSWTLTVTLGMLVGSAIPTAWRLDVAPAIMFAGLVVLGLTNRPGVVAAITGAVVCLLALDVPNNGGILVGAISGVTAGYLADLVQSRRVTSRAAST
jgi:predicted branched-subunit amino acid permease